MLLKFKTTLSSLSPRLFDIVGIILFLSIFYAIWMGSYPLFTPDEGRYSEVAREMIVTHDYITPRLNGVAFLDKPILYYWLQASAIKLFGLNEAALRFWPVVMGILACVFIYLAGYQLFNRRTGILSALLLATSPLFYGAAHYANLDLEVGSLISITLLCFLIAEKRATASRPYSTIFFLLAYVFAALAFLTKGLIGIAFPALIGGTWILLLNRWYILKQMRVFSGICIFLSITVPWYVLAQKANPQFFHYFFVTQQISRFLTTQTFNSQNPGWFYLPIIALGFFPWTIFLVQAVWQNLSAILKNRQAHATELFLLLWIVFVFTFFSIPHSKTIGYILPIFPGLALLTGRYMDTHWKNSTATGIRLGLIFYALASILILAAFLIVPYVKVLEVDPVLIPYFNWVGVLFLLSGLLLFVLRKQSFNKLFPILFTTACLFLLSLSASAPMLNQKSIKPLALYLKTIIQPRDEVATYFKYYQDLPIYLEKRITMVADWAATDIAENDNWVREMWYGMPFQDTRDWLIQEDTFWQRWHSPKKMFVFLSKSYFDEFCAKTHSKVYTLKQFHEVFLVSNQPKT